VRPFQALVLAGSRGGPDPLAEAAGVSHKALIRLEGRTLLERVVGALREAGAGRIAVSANHPDVRDEAERLGVEVLEATAGPSASVEAGAAALGTPLLVTTSDHALLQPQWVRRFLDDAPADADVCALLARRETVETDAPATQRTYLRLADGHWSGCNLFYLATPQALGAGEDVFLQTEHDAPVHRNDPAFVAAFVHLGITQEGMRHSHWVPGPAWLACTLGALPDAERLQQDVGIVSEGV